MHPPACTLPPLPQVDKDSVLRRLLRGDWPASLSSLRSSWHDPASLTAHCAGHDSSIGHLTSPLRRPPGPRRKPLPPEAPWQQQQRQQQSQADGIPGSLAAGMSPLRRPPRPPQQGGISAAAAAAAAAAGGASGALSPPPVQAITHPAAPPAATTATTAAAGTGAGGDGLAAEPSRQCLLSAEEPPAIAVYLNASYLSSVAEAGAASARGGSTAAEDEAACHLYGNPSCLSCSADREAEHGDDAVQQNGTPSYEYSSAGRGGEQEREAVLMGTPAPQNGLTAAGRVGSHGDGSLAGEEQEEEDDDGVQPLLAPYTISSLPGQQPQGADAAGAHEDLDAGQLQQQPQQEEEQEEAKGVEEVWEVPTVLGLVLLHPDLTGQVGGMVASLWWHGVGGCMIHVGEVQHSSQGQTHHLRAVIHRPTC